MKNKIICINLSEDLYDKVKKNAKNKQLSISALIRLIVLENINK